MEPVFNSSSTVHVYDNTKRRMWKSTSMQSLSDRWQKDIPFLATQPNEASEDVFKANPVSIEMDQQNA